MASGASSTTSLLSSRGPELVAGLATRRTMAEGPELMRFQGVVGDPVATAPFARGRGRPARSHRGAWVGRPGSATATLEAALASTGPCTTAVGGAAGDRGSSVAEARGDLGAAPASRANEQPSRHPTTRREPALSENPSQRLQIEWNR